MRRRDLLRGTLALAASGTLSRLASAAGPAAPAPAQPSGPRAELRAHRARYVVSYRGVTGGELESTLRPGSEPGVWLYETRAFPNLLARVAVSPEARERSTMRVAGGKVQPLTFDFNDGSSSSNKDVRFTFDWVRNVVRGQVDGQPIEMPVPPGTQDTASVQVAMLVDLLAGRSPQSFPILTGKRLREYRYWPEGTATVQTPHGRHEAVAWANQRDGSVRLTRVWHAPGLGYLPVQAIQFRKGHAETVMKLVRFERP